MKSLSSPPPPSPTPPPTPPPTPAPAPPSSPSPSSAPTPPSTWSSLRYSNSLSTLFRARTLIPGGTQTLSKRAERFPEGAYPVFLRKTHGCKTWDVDGHPYIDWIMSLGAVAVGHRHPIVIEAVKKQLHDGPLFSLGHPLEIELAARLCELIPCGTNGMVRFVKTGSEATEAAVRMARMATGREVILTVDTGYHCYSDDTEVLTMTGFKRFTRLRVGELLATRNQESGLLQYEPAQEIINELHFGELLHVTGLGVDLLVTPEHRMIRSNEPECLAADIERGDRLPRAATWVGDACNTITIGRRTLHGVSRKNRMRGIPTKGIISFPAEAFMRLVGWFIAEGWCQKHKRARYEIHLAQNPGALHEQIWGTIKDLGFAPRHEREYQIVFASKELWYFLRQCGDGARNKRIPKRLKALSPQLLQILLDALIDGDGTRSGGRTAFYTTSPHLADDVQEIACKLGLGTVRNQYVNKGGAIIMGKAVMARQPIIHVRFTSHSEAIVRDVSRQQFMGRVVCARTKNGQLFVRRNGRALWCGNSWHSWFAASKPLHPGVPKCYESVIRTFRYNDLESFAMALGSGEDVAAVLMEPTCFVPPEPGFLEAIRSRTREVGALLIFDEVLTGFRWHLQGAQAMFHVEPDLATFGKALASGFPLACLIGRRDLMEHAWVVSGTFGGECIALAAALATLAVYQSEFTIDKLWRAGRDLMEGLTPITEGLPLTMDGFPCLPRLTFTQDSALAMSVFLQELAARGILFHPANLKPSAAHKKADVEQTLIACQEALAVVHEGMAEGDLAKRLKGKILDLGPVRQGA